MAALLFLASSGLLSSCFSLEKITANGAAAIAPYGEHALQDETSYEAFRRGAPAGLQMLEASLGANPGQQKIIFALAKGYNGYATVVAETDLLIAHLASDHNAVNDATELAVRYHERAILRARQYLAGVGLKWSVNPDDLTKGLRDLSTSQDVTDMIFVAAHSMKSLVALQKGKSFTLTYMPIAEVLSQYACGTLKPSYPLWGCEVMAAVELAERPAVAGGDLKKATKIFSDVARKYPNDLLPSSILAQSVLKKTKDEKAWKQVKEFSQKIKSSFFERQKTIVTGNDIPASSTSNLMNAAAIRRIDQITTVEKEFF